MNHLVSFLAALLLAAPAQAVNRTRATPSQARLRTALNPRKNTLTFRLPWTKQAPPADAMRLEVTVGTAIDDAVANLLRTANAAGQPVATTFGGIELVAHPNDTFSSVRRPFTQANGWHTVLGKVGLRSGRELLGDLAAEAKASGAEHPDHYAFGRLAHPKEIDAFVRSYLAHSPFQRTLKIESALLANNVMRPGTAPDWERALAKHAGAKFPGSPR